MLGRGSTEDAFTGPPSDHTLQNADGTYLFIDASPPRLPDQKAVLVSEMVAPGEISCLEFWYHMFGQVRVVGSDVCCGDRRVLWGQINSVGQVSVMRSDVCCGVR